MSATKPKLIVRTAETKDIETLIALCRKVYPEITPYSAAQLRGMLRNFPEGQMVAAYEGRIVGFCATFRTTEALAFAKHTWSAITGGGYASRHDGDGEWLYGMEVFVDPEMRGARIGQRLYAARRRLAEQMNLKGVVFGGRLPGFGRRQKRWGTAEAYAQAVAGKGARDPVLSFQLRNGFELLGVLPEYLPSDHESRGNAAHLVWRNPQYVAGEAPSRRKPRARDVVRVSVVQYMQRQIGSFEDFARNIEYFVDVVADYKADFVVFPELFTLQLLSIENAPLSVPEAISTLTQYTQPLKEALSDLAVRYNVNIIGGSHPTRSPDSDEILNICYVCLRDGAIHEQPKIHPTPNERYWWNIEGGNIVRTIETDCGPIGVLICYDSEFPELARHLIDQGAELLFVPFCTDERQSYLRVRYCSQARAVENQCYVAMAGNVGNLPNVENMDIQYAQSCILTPCDFPFARDGIAADTTPNAEMVAFADLRLDALREARRSGTVQNLKDRRFDMYATQWRARD